MQITNKEEYKEIRISSLNLSTRSFNSLMHAGFNTLYLLIENADQLEKIPNMGVKSIAEIEELLRIIEAEGLPVSNSASSDAGTSDEVAEMFEPLSILPDKILSRPATDLRVSVRICNSFRLEGIETIGQVITLKASDILRMKNMGTLSCQQLLDEIEQLKVLGDAYFETEEDDIEATEETPEYNKRELDIVTVRKLRENYGFKTIWLSEWYNLSRQRIYQKLSKRINHGRWCGKELLSDERASITEMINQESFFKEADGKKYYLVNNLVDDCAFLVVSETDIKCFFLEELPVALQALVKSYNLHRFSDNECVAVKELGKKISILKKDYFMPNDSATFRSLATARRMSNDEYANFLFGLPYKPAHTSVTDERIVSFLRENTTNGRTLIPLTPDTQWIRSYISRSPYSMDEFVAFYGFSTTGSENSEELDFAAEDFSVVEKDMQIHEYTGTDYIEKVYAKFPLLGSAILSEKNIDILNKNSKVYIGRLLNHLHIEPEDEMQVALAVINYAKGWNTEDESGFWRYITAQFGYRDESGKLRELLGSCVENALVRNHRWFITNASRRQFKSSIMVHSFSTQKSWLHFCDFLFDFYKTNLNWEYIENDPIIDRMVLALHNKMCDKNDPSDENIEISSKVYYFREGITKLIMYRPKYATQLISSMIRRIDGIINHTAAAATCYEELLCDKWMTSKLQGIFTTRRKDPSGERRSIAIDYTRVKPVYQLVNETDVRIVFPDVRLAQNDFSSLKLTIYHDGHVVEQRTLSYYGNELGKTMSGFGVNLEDYLRRSASDRFDPHLVITCDAEEIYNSRKVLFRECLAFKNKTETDISSCEQGGYSVFVPKIAVAEFVNAEISTIKENVYLKGYYAELQKDFVININGELAAFDNTQDGDTFRVMVPGNGSEVDYIVNGVKYSIITGREDISIVASGQGAEKKYRLVVNSELIDMETLPHEDLSGARVYKTAIGRYGVDEISLRLIDLANNRLLLHRNFKLIPNFTYRFNRAYYYSTDDFREARLRVTAGNESMKEFPVAQGDTHISIPYQEGELDIPVPVIKIVDNANNKWDGSNICWIKDIPQERFLHVEAPAGISPEILLDGRPIGTEGTNAFALGNAIYGYTNQNNCRWLEVVLSVSKNGEENNRYVLGKIATREQFIEEPVLKIENGRLIWDRGYGFIGNDAGTFRLNICIGTEYETGYDLELNQEKIADSIDLPLGEYKYAVSKQSGNLFSLQPVTVASGNFFVGDVNEIRFLKYIIQIDSITFEDDTKYKAVPVRPCYIDHIEYKGVQYVCSEDRECPVYTGIMFFINNGERHEYSHKDGKDGGGNLLYQINPVRIIYINDSTLSITNETGDGFYYYRYQDKYTKVDDCQITDREPIARKNPYTGKLEQPKNYFLADLYSYTKKGV